MPAEYFICPDNETIKITDCLRFDGCRIKKRCASMRTLQLVGYNRKWRLSPSCAGNGPRYEYLRATIDYPISPDSRMFAILGTGSHAKLHKYEDNVLSEQSLKDSEMTGTSDDLEMDEQNPGKYILIDDKTWGSFKVAKALGVVKEEETVLDDNNKPILFKSGKRKGQPKTRNIYSLDPTAVDMFDTELQINRYRIFWEQLEYPISKMFVEVIVRDGGTASAFARKIDKRLYLIPVKRLENNVVLKYYRNLNNEVMKAFQTGYARLCNNWESWDHKRCEGFCDVRDQCIQISKKFNEKWGIL